MNTVLLLKLASNALGLSPHRAMEIAESLYTSGFISPAHRDDPHPSTFDHQTMAQHAACRSLPWAPLCEWLAARAAPPTRGGVDAGDHPPITPTARRRAARSRRHERAVLRGVQALRGELAAAGHLRRANAGGGAAGERLEPHGIGQIERGWLQATPHRATESASTKASPPRSTASLAVTPSPCVASR